MRGREHCRRRDAGGNRRMARRACSVGTPLPVGEASGGDIEALLDAWIDEFVARGERDASPAASNIPESLRLLLDVAMSTLLGDWYGFGQS
jgi:hypothetical protein